MKAELKHYRQSPRKVRLVANAIRGKSVPHALAQLAVMNKRAGGPIEKLLRSAAANAKQNFNKESAALFVKDVRVGEGVVLKRSQPAWRGTAHPIKKRRSHVTIVLGDSLPKKEKKIKKVSKAKK